MQANKNPIHLVTSTCWPTRFTAKTGHLHLHVRWLQGHSMTSSYTGHVLIKRAIDTCVRFVCPASFHLMFMDTRSPLFTTHGGPFRPSHRKPWTWGWRHPFSPHTEGHSAPHTGNPEQWSDAHPFPPHKVGHSAPHTGNPEQQGDVILFHHTLWAVPPLTPETLEQ